MEAIWEKQQPSKINPKMRNGRIYKNVKQYIYTNMNLKQFQILEAYTFIYPVATLEHVQFKFLFQFAQKSVNTFCLLRNKLHLTVK